MNFKKNNIEYNLCITLAIIINLGLLIFSKSMFDIVLLTTTIIVLLLPIIKSPKKSND